MCLCVKDKLKAFFIKVKQSAIGVLLYGVNGVRGLAGLPFRIELLYQYNLSIIWTFCRMYWDNNKKVKTF